MHGDESRRRSPASGSPATGTRFRRSRPAPGPASSTLLISAISSSRVRSARNSTSLPTSTERTLRCCLASCTTSSISALSRSGVSPTQAPSETLRPRRPAIRHLIDTVDHRVGPDALSHARDDRQDPARSARREWFAGASSDLRPQVWTVGNVIDRTVDIGWGRRPIRQIPGCSMNGRCDDHRSQYDPHGMNRCDGDEEGDDRVVALFRAAIECRKPIT